MKKQILLLTALVSLAFGFRDIEGDELAMMAEAKESVVVDVRLQEEWKESGVINDSFLITYFDEKARPMKSAFLKKLSQITEGDKTKPVVLVCRTGLRSKLVAGILEREGYKNVYNYKDGMVAWLNENRKVIKPKN